MTRVASILGHAGRIVSRSRPLRRIATGGYRVVADLAAQRLAAIDGVRSVYLTGSLAHGSHLDPGQSDIDLLAVCEFDSVSRELAILERLRTFQRRASVFGGLFYNLDCLDVRDIAFARAFGGAWEMRLDAHGLCLAGEPLWDAPVKRPAAEVQNEQLSMALRRWINTAARLLDPRVSFLDPHVLRSARRLIADAAERFSGAPLESDAFRDAARRAGLACALDVAHRGTAALTASDVLSSLVPAALEVIDAFAAETTRPFRDEFQTVAPSATAGADSLRPAPLPDATRTALDAFSASILGPPFESVVLVRKGVLARDSLPLVLASDGHSATDLVREYRARAGRAEPALSALTGVCRRPVLATRALWSALPLVEPSPFVAAFATEPLYQRGAVPPPIAAPSAATIDALLRARAVERFTLCRGPELRPKMSEAFVRDALMERFALLSALDRALKGHVFVAAHDDPSLVARSPEQRARTLQEWSARCRERFAAELDGRG